MPRNKGIDVDILKGYVMAQKTNAEISRLMGISKGTVSSQIARNGLSGIRAEKVKRRVSAGFNGDRHLCVNCKYRCRDGHGCDYIIYTGKERGCNAAECSVYEVEIKEATCKKAMYNEK